MLNAKSVLTACGAFLGVAVVVVASVHAGGPATRATNVTFGRAVALPRTTLGPGTYTFELASPFSDADVVLVRAKDHSQVYFMGFTRRIERPPGLRADRQVTLGEARAGGPAPVTAWYPDGESMGHQFIYQH
jgi:hypothetical protein